MPVPALLLFSSTGRRSRLTAQRDHRIDARCLDEGARGRVWAECAEDQQIERALKEIDAVFRQVSRSAGAPR